MAKFGGDDFNDEFGDEFNDDFNERFNRMMNDKGFRNKYNKFRSELEELMRLISRKNNGYTPFNFRFIPLNNPRMDENQNDFNIPDGEMDVEKGSDENGDWEKKYWSSPDGSMSFTSFSRSSSFDDDNGLPDGMAELFGSVKPKVKNPKEEKKLKLAKLQKTLDYLVEQEKYEKAAEIKKMIEDLNKPSE